MWRKEKVRCDQRKLSREEDDIHKWQASHLSWKRGCKRRRVEERLHILFHSTSPCTQDSRVQTVQNWEHQGNGHQTHKWHEIRNALVKAQDERSEWCRELFVNKTNGTGECSATPVLSPEIDKKHHRRHRTQLLHGKIRRWAYCYILVLCKRESRICSTQNKHNSDNMNHWVVKYIRFGQ